MAVSTSIRSTLLLSLICFLSSFSSAKLILKGETLEFPPCPTKPYLPIFEFRPHGSTNYLTYAYGTQPRPATPDRFNARLGKTDDGGKLTSLRYTRKVRWGLAKRANFEIDKGRAKGGKARTEQTHEDCEAYFMTCFKHELQLAACLRHFK